MPYSISDNNLTHNTNGFNKKRRDTMENDEDFMILISRDGCNVNLESMNIISEVYKYLENKFRKYYILT